ncbi:MAG TPA: histidine kinase dimerization/phosphoacceptor domain -containing protein [Spirochaetota bacterium]|nr:histidine kinase dimerization/phosphoacceptor domain -containing protein [Spirochaetota bacterium]
MKRTMNWLSRQSIRVQLAVLVAACVLPALAIILYTGIESINLARAGAGENALRLVRGIASHQEGAVENTRRLLIKLSHVYTAGCRWGGSSQFLREILRINPMYANLKIASADGTVHASAVSSESFSIAEHGYFRDAVKTGEFAVGNYMKSRIAKRMVLHCAYPVVSGGTVRSVLVATIDVSYYERLFIKANLPEGSSLVLADHTGTRIYRYPHPEKYEGLVDLDHMIRNMSGARVEGSFIDRGADGVRRLYGYKRLYHPGKREPIYLRVGIPERIALAGANFLVLRNLALLGVAAALALLLAYALGTSTIVRPLERLVAASRRLGLGDLSARTGMTHDGGEIGQLATAFDEMAAAIATKERERANSERKLRESGERYRSLVENINEVIYTLDMEGRLTYISPAAYRLSQFTVDDIIGKEFINYVHPDDLPGLREMYKRALAGEIEQYEYRIFDKDGSVRHVRTSSRLLVEDGKPVGITGLMSDITEKRLNEERLRTSLREKETLLREIHHRVKNNLQVITSFLNLQSREIKDPALLELFRNSERRIRSMALIHEQLYRSDNFSMIDFGKYIENLARYLHGIYQIGSRFINWRVNAESIFLSIDRAIPCGLLLNEVLSNSFKHAFHGRERGEISVEFKRHNNHYSLAAADDGVGFQDDFTGSAASTLGFQIIISLVDQIGGSMEIRRDNGAGVIITFPVDDPYKARI